MIVTGNTTEGDLYLPLMKKNIAYTAIFALGLAACTTPEVKIDNALHEESQSSIVSSTISADWVTVNDEQFGLGFSYPSAWGQWSLTQIPSQPNTDALAEMSFSELDRTIQYPHTGNADVNVTMRRYDENQYRYEEVCDGSINFCETTRQQDLLQEKEDFIKKSAQTIGGAPATVQDFYDVPSGYVAREVQFYTRTHRVHFIAIYDIGDFLIAHGPHDSSLYDTAKRLLGSELSDPINRLSKMYPTELQEMTRFYQDVDRLLESIRVLE